MSLVEDIHPEIAERRKANRSLLATVDIYNNGDVEYHIPIQYRVFQNLRFIVTRLEQARKAIVKNLKEPL